MYKWHVHSAIGRGRPVASDISRVADGIANSLRLFSVSASKAAEGSDKPSGSRAERSANAAREVSSLAPRRGIDARSLAAKPPPSQGFTIRRVDASGAPVESIGGDRGGFAGRGGRGGFVSRGSSSGFAPRGRGGFRGRGGLRGRGGRGGRGAARGAKRGRGRSTGPTVVGQQLEDPEAPLDAEEQAWVDGFESGFEIPYNPTTNLEYLRSHGAAAMPPSSPMGVVESVAHKFQVATGMSAALPLDMHPASHLMKMHGGGGSSFGTPQAKAAVQAYYDQFRQAEADKRADSEGRERKKVAPKPIPTMDQLPESLRSEIAKVWIAGHYNRPKNVDKGDILGTVDTYTKRNETYLPHSAKSFEAKLRSLLPAAYRKQAAGIVPEPKKGGKPTQAHVS